ncbi:MAG: DUF3108 domain-containing protein [Candidatus Omnitrophica bacterium]|nr:DUF3108 domain-containing protein [Candidatus Omnitrophota bacterium]
MDKKSICRIVGSILGIALISGCMGVRWSATNKTFDAKGRMLLDAQQIVIETPDQRLPENEVLTFHVQWLGMAAGDITASIKGIKNINGRDAYVLEAVFKSSGFLSAVYKIEDRYVSYLDIEKLHTLRHEVYRREGKFKKDAITEFDQEHHKAKFKNFVDNSEKTFDIPANVQDTLSALYYFMLIQLKGGEKAEFAVSNNEANYQLFAIVESRAFIKTPGVGEKRAFLIQPYARLKGEKVEKGNLKAYFSCEKRRLPLLAILQGPVFTEVTLVLEKVEYPVVAKPIVPVTAPPAVQHAATPAAVPVAAPAVQPIAAPAAQSIAAPAVQPTATPTDQPTPAPASASN